ncbi:hypothetical protein JG688_00007820 [Phytophthora aleatoria]|uniref:Uncharacterized protein n=1 Tax=Phytophthora aleatoria TaxID=2496075 RepID=A0A8J5M508_9STRA|nr:hypothetical protein JG688_00007820 [Phytophthora aleatoria]
MCIYFIRWLRPMTRCRRDSLRERGAPSAPKCDFARQQRQDTDCQKSIRAVCPSCVRCLAPSPALTRSDVTMIERTTRRAAQHHTTGVAKPDRLAWLRFPAKPRPPIS